MYKGKCIIRCARAGVFFANVAKLDGQTAELHDARRLWYWDGAATLSQLAQAGVKKPRNCKFSVTVPVMTVMEVIEIIPCTAEAVESVSGVSEWKI